MGVSSLFVALPTSWRCAGAAVIAPNALALITAFPRVSRKRAMWST